MSQGRIRAHVWALFACTAALVAAAPAAAGEPALKRTQTIELVGKPGKLDHMAVDSKGQRLFLANRVNDTLDVVDLKAGKLLKQLTGQGGAQGVAYAADQDRVYVALGTGGFTNVFDGKNYQLLETVKFKDDADNIRYNPKTKLVYVAHAENSLGVIDTKTYDVKVDIKLPGGAEAFQLETGRARLYVNVPSTSEVIVIDTDKHQVVTKFPLKAAGANMAMALDEANKRLFIGCRKEPMVVVLDADTGKQVATVGIPGDIDDLFYDAKRKRLYATCGEGAIAVIRQTDADNYQMLEKITTVKDARTGTFDADTGRLYLGVPRQAGKKGPEIWVYQAP